MKRHFVLVVVLSGLLMAGCGDDRGVAPLSVSSDVGRDIVVIDPELVAGEIINGSGWEFDPQVELPPQLALLGDKALTGRVLEFGREVVTGDIVHYWWQIPVGPDPNAKFGLHRVVKERRPLRPIRTDKTLFALHGTPGFFKVMFLFGSQTSAPDDHSLAAFLAERDVDVWGIDQAYTLVPQGVTDFSFMADWGMQFDIDNLRAGMAVARIVRLLTGSGYGKMTLLGYSTGLVTGFSALNHETQLPECQRQIGAYIPVDNFVKTDRPEWTASECGYLGTVQEWLDAGIYHNDYGVLFQTFGYLAQTDPEGASPIIPDLTNLQAALLAGAQTSVLFGLPGDLHFLAGVFDGSGMPVDLTYTPLQQYLEWLQGFNNYGSNLFEYDFTAIHCGEVDVPFDDHLGEIGVPLFFLGAGGGWGGLMDYTISLMTGSPDVTLLNVSLQPDPLLDIGHVDIFTASNAAGLFWQPILDWVVAHTPGAGGHGHGVAGTQ